MARAWPELVALRSGIIALTSELRGINWIDIDEAGNRVAIGVSSSQVESRIRDLVRENQLDDSALAFDIGVPVSMTQTLMSRLRPLSGGSQIGPSGCTLGITVLRNGSDQLLTAGHCSTVIDSLDGGPVFQPNGGTAPWLGHEVADGGSWTCGMYLCKNADVSAFSLSIPDTTGGELWVRHGRIARTTYRSWGPSGSYGSITIDASDPYFEIGMPVQYPVLNEYVEKVGVTSGWTHGYVYKTCVDVHIIHDGKLLKFLCQDFASLNSQPGDSGSPVFWHSIGAKFYGLLWGHDGTYGAVFSSYHQLVLDLGAFDVVAPY